MSKITGRKRSSPRLQVSFIKPSRVMPEFQDECNVNSILARYGYNAVAASRTFDPNKYMDLSSPLDFQSHMQSIADANNAFSELPSNVRNHYQNDPSLFLEAIHNPDKRSELEFLGLVSKSPVSDQKVPPEEGSKNAESAAL